MTNAYPASRRLIAVTCLAATLVFACTARAATYYLKIDQTSSGGGNWTTTNAWNTLADGSGTNRTLATDANTYNTNANAVRSTGTTFTGGSLVVSGHSTDAGGANYSLMLTTSSMSIGTLSTQAYSVGNNFTLIRSTIASATSLSSTNFSVGVETRFHFQTSIGRSLSYSITTLTGSGDMHMGQDGTGAASASTIALSATTASAYTGNIIVYNGTNLDFNNAFSSGGGLQLLTGSIVTLDQNLTFNTVSIAGTALAAGTYSFATLNASYDAFFANGGSGGITVLSPIPEPSTATALVGVAALALVIRRRPASRA